METYRSNSARSFFAGYSLVMILGVLFYPSRNMWDRSLAVRPEILVVTEMEAHVQLGIENSNLFKI